MLLERGHRLRPADIALAALAGADPVSVFRAPRIAVAVTGDELVRGSARPAPGSLRDSNGPMLLAECAARGWPARRCEAVRDDSAASHQGQVVVGVRNPEDCNATLTFAFEEAALLFQDLFQNDRPVRND